MAEALMMPLCLGFSSCSACGGLMHNPLNLASAQQLMVAHQVTVRVTIEGTALQGTHRVPLAISVSPAGSQIWWRAIPSLPLHKLPRPL